jgi:pSer/pThr/pTyr-binding forkhead associated (FHA) protein
VSIQTLAVPGASKEGFVSRDALGVLARAQPAAAFARQYGFPALYIFDIAPSGTASGASADETVRDGPQLMTLMQKGGNALRYLYEVGFLVKRPGNPFPQFVSVGRAANNDLVFAIDSVSKFHGYFTYDGGEWALTDYRSTNGTELNGKKLEPAVATPVKSGDRIRIGTHLCAEFLDPASLHAKLCG